jgi:D-aminoacyl-tRNA deacylase
LAIKLVIQRVKQASVTVDSQVVGAINTGLLVLVGIGHDTTEAELAKLAHKLLNLRIFSDAAGLMNQSVLQINGEILAVSQFTLHADTRKGNRPSYTDAARPEVAKPLFDRFVVLLREGLGKPVPTGIFGADMAVSLLNDGPVTIVM